MIPHSLTLSAFGSFRRTTVIDFDTLCADGLFLLSGDAAAGKTTLTDALFFALYGRCTDGRIMKRDASSFRSRLAGPTEETRVELVFSHGGTRYRITHSPAYSRAKMRGSGTFTVPASAALTCLDTGESLTDLAEVDRCIADIFGTFMLPHYICGNDGLMSLLSQTNADLTDTFRTLFGTARFVTMEAEAKTAAEACRGQLDALDNSILTLLGKTSFAPNTDRSRFHIYEHDISQLPLAIQEVESLIASDRESLQTLKQSVREANQKVREAAGAIDLTAYLRKINNELTDAIRRHDNLMLRAADYGEKRKRLAAASRAETVNIPAYLFHSAERNRIAASEHPERLPVNDYEIVTTPPEKQLQAYINEERKLYRCYTQALEDAGFTSEEAYLGAKLTASEYQKLEEDIAHYDAQCAALTEQIDTLRKQAATIPANRHDEATKRYFSLKKTLTAAEKDYRRTERRANANALLHRMLRDYAVRRRDLAEAYEKASARHRAAAGLDTGLNLEQTELRRAFDRTLASANPALSVLTDGAYSLCRAGEDDFRMRAVLIPEVIDNKSGEHFPIASLCSHEMTAAALALRIGLFDALRGHIAEPLPELIIFDGCFDTADEDFACRIVSVLRTFAEGSVSVGLIARPGIFERLVPHRLPVKKGTDGSCIEDDRQ